MYQLRKYTLKDQESLDFYRNGRPAFSDEAAVLEEGRAIVRTLLEKTNLTDYPDTAWRTSKPVTGPDRASTPAR